MPSPWFRPACVCVGLLMLVTELLVFLVAGEALGHEEMRAYRVWHLLQMLALLSLAGFCLWNRTVSTSAKFIVLALGLSLCGDVINSYLIDLSFLLQPQTLLSVLPFGLAHVLYVLAFVQLARSGRSAGFWLWPFALLWPLLGLVLWRLIVDAQAGPLLHWLSLAYSQLVTLMTLSGLFVAWALGRPALWAALGGLLFLGSDALLGAWLLEAAQRPLWVSQCIWLSYFLAQLCIVQLLPLALSEPDGKLHSKMNG